MKKLSIGFPFGSLVLLAAVSGFSQPQLFEQGQSGLIPYTGLKWNSKITQPIVGLEYNIEGRTSLGFKVAKPLKDSLSFDPDLKAYLINPYVDFELVEPGNLTIFSFSVRGEIIKEDVTRPDSNYNGFGRIRYGGGPVFAFRFQTSDKLTVVPSASYELFYVKWNRNWLGAPQIDQATGQQKRDISGNLLYENRHEKDTHIWHDVMGGVNLLYRISERQGLIFEPKLVAKIGTGLSDEDLINLDVNLGYFLVF